MEHSSVFIESGLTTPLALVHMEDKGNIMKTVALHHVLLRTKAEIDQFTAGLNLLGVLELIQENHQLFQKFFCLDGAEHVTAGT